MWDRGRDIKPHMFTTQPHTPHRGEREEVGKGGTRARNDKREGGRNYKLFGSSPISFSSALTSGRSGSRPR
jgi:hypothetical protein